MGPNSPIMRSGESGVRALSQILSLKHISTGEHSLHLSQGSTHRLRLCFLFWCRIVIHWPGQPWDLSAFNTSLLSNFDWRNEQNWGFPGIMDDYHFLKLTIFDTQQQLSITNITHKVCLYTVELAVIAKDRKRITFYNSHTAYMHICLQRVYKNYPPDRCNHRHQRVQPASLLKIKMM